jgi:tight adherence protein B
MLWITIAVFVGVACLVGSLALLAGGKSDPKLEDRLDVLAGLKSAAASNAPKDTVIKQGALADVRDASSGVWGGIKARFENFRYLFDQADVSITAAQFFGISAGLAVVGGAAVWFARLHVLMIPVAALAGAVLPLMWLLFKRKRRLKAFQAQLPDALELIARALRAGHSLGSGLNLVAEEMPAPIGTEFGRAFEEQNLGIPLEDALKSLTRRVPNLDLKFFATAVILQRTTGGDLAEILDKIGYIIRERFRIWGQVQALTGEGRLSGIVLLALPPVLFLAVYNLNPKYASKLFTDPMGQQMLIFAAVLQVLGALVIRKIVNIKV